jgi:ATP-dependent helicase HrpB
VFQKVSAYLSGIMILPIDEFLDQIVNCVRTQSQVILTASPGAGKTTRLPPHLLQAVTGKVAVLEPRRMATVAASQFVATENNWTIGKEVGYQVRFESRVSSETRLVFMTDAVLLRRLVDDPELRDFDLVVIDEFHERNLHQDVILGVLKELQEMGRDIKILIMSATLDLKQLQEFLPESVTIDVPGKVFPLEVRHSSQPMSLQTDFSFIQRVCDAVLNAATSTRGDILVFLPGVGEILRTRDLLIEKKVSREVFPLHGSLSLNEQKSVLQTHENPRVILATNIAEASVTVNGVNWVIDSGLSRVLTTNLNSGFSRLELTGIAQFNARQRAGRAARQQAGTCVRLWTKHEEASQDQEMAPECQRAELSSTLLLLAHLGISDFKNFAWLSSPPPMLLQKASLFLKSVGALNEQQHLTELGKKLLRFPVTPRWGALLALSEKIGSIELAARTVALLQDRDILIKNENVTTHLECDITYRLQTLDDLAVGKKVGGVLQKQADHVLEMAIQLQRLLTEPKTKLDHGLSRLLLLSQRDRLCRRRGDSDRGIMVGGRGVRLSRESQVKTSEFFVALDGVDLPGQSETLVSLASGLDKGFVLEVLKDHIDGFEETIFDPEKGQFYLKKTRRFQDLEIDEPQLTKINAADLGDQFVNVLVARWPWLVDNNTALKHWIERWRFYVKDNMELEKQLTAEHIRQTLEMASFGKTKIDDVVESHLVSFLESVMDKAVVKKFHQDIPARFAAPSGGSHLIDYSSGAPTVEVRLQEVFGLTKTPKIGQKNTPLVFKLLAPNFRPVQVTSDIEGFWQRAYVDVRKELRGRYPKHSWPDDPLTAIPVAKGRRRS